MSQRARIVCAARRVVLGGLLAASVASHVRGGFSAPGRGGLRRRLLGEGEGEAEAGRNAMGFATFESTGDWISLLCVVVCLTSAGHSAHLTVTCSCYDARFLPLDDTHGVPRLRCPFTSAPSTFPSRL